MVLYISNSLSASIEKDINLSFLSPPLKVSTYSLILGSVKTIDVIIWSKYPIKYLESVFILISFEIIILSTLKSGFLLVFYTFTLFFSYICLTKSQHYYTIKNVRYYLLAN